MSFIEISNVSKFWGDVKAVENLNISVDEGEFVGLVGPNGGGKTTFLLTILGILKSRKGTIEIYGQKPASKSILGKIGWVSQSAANIPNNNQSEVLLLLNPFQQYKTDKAQKGN